MTIRPALPKDALDISALILAQLPLITLHPEGLGADAVIASMQPDGLAQKIDSPGFHYWVYESEGEIQGVLGLRDGTHLYQLFVKAGLHRTGIGRQLWTHMLSTLIDNPPSAITVNASPYGLAAYEKLGFVATGVRTETNGIAFIPMTYSPNEKGICK